MIIVRAKCNEKRPTSSILQRQPLLEQSVKEVLLKHKITTYNTLKVMLTKMSFILVVITKAGIICTKNINSAVI